MNIGKFRPLETKLVLGILFIDLLFVFLASIFLASSHTQYQNNLIETSHNLALLLEQVIADEARLLDDAVLRVQRELTYQMAAGRVDIERIEQILSSEQKQLPEIDAIRITNAAGDVIFGKGVAPGVVVSYADREFFQKHQRHTVSDLIITEPMKGKVSGIWVIAFTRCYHSADGTFAGIISAAVPVDTFSRLLAMPSLGKTGTAVLRYANMGLIARFPPIKGEAGRPGHDKVSTGFVKIIESGVNSATFHSANTPDSVERTYTVHRIPGRPFTIAVGLVDDEYFAPWKSQIVWVSVMLGLFFLGSSVFTWKGVRYLRERAVRTQASRDDNTRRRILIEQSRDGIAVLDQEGKVWETNKRFAEMLGYTPAEVRQLHVWEWDAQSAREELLAAIKDIGPAGDHFETRHRRKDGTVFDVEISTNGAFYSGRKQVFCVCRDISARRKNEEKVRESEKKFRSAYTLMRMLCDNVPDMIWAKDLDKRYLFANKALCSNLLNAADTDEPIGKIDMFFAERERAQHADNPEWHTFGEICRDTDGITMDAGTPQQFDEYGNIMGKFLFLDVHKAPFIDENGRMIGTVGSARDVTFVKVLEKQIQESENKFRGVFESSPMGIVIVERETNKFLEANTSYLEMLGYTEEELLTKRVVDITHPDDWEFEKVKIEEKKQHPDKKFSIEKRYIKKNGGICWGQVTVEYFVSQTAGQLLIGNIVDISERKKVEAENRRLEAQNQQLQKAESLGIMAGAIAHHFNNLLGVVIGNLEMAIEDLPLHSATAKILTDAIQGASKASEISSALLMYLGQTTGLQTPLDLSQACRQILHLLKVVTPVGVKIEIDLPALGPVIIGNMNQLQQVLTNLIANASEASGEARKPIFLTVRTVAADDIQTVHRLPIGWLPHDKFYACLEVRDTGCGIADDDIDKLFDPFFTSKFTGRGLGLAVALGIVKAHGGAVAVESATGQGSAFRIYLPVLGELLSNISTNRHHS
jgi:PAS domain S-box-containing protein